MKRRAHDLRKKDASTRDNKNVPDGIGGGMKRRAHDLRQEDAADNSVNAELATLLRESILSLNTKFD